MKRDIIGDIFLGGVLLSLLFMFSFPVYFSFSQVTPRAISFPERMMSVCFSLALLLTVIWTCWKKKVWVMLGLLMFSILPYLPKWFLPKLESRALLHGKNIMDSFWSMFLNRIYELVHAPFTGLVGIFPEKTVRGLPYRLLPLVLLSYVLSQIVRFYHNAYVTEKKQMHDFSRFRKVHADQMPVFAAAAEAPEAPSPLGTIIKNEKDEIAKETYSVKPSVEEPTQQIPAIESPASDTQVIALAANAPTSRPAADETQVIALAANAPTSKKASDETQVIALAASAPTSKGEEEKKEEKKEDEVISLSAHAPTSAVELPAKAASSAVELPAKAPSAAEEPSEKAPSSAELDFPDVHGEAEKIDVFGDDELS